MNSTMHEYVTGQDPKVGDVVVCVHPYTQIPPLTDLEKVLVMGGLTFGARYVVVDESAISDGLLVVRAVSDADVKVRGLYARRFALVRRSKVLSLPTESDHPIEKLMAELSDLRIERDTLKADVAQLGQAFSDEFDKRTRAEELAQLRMATIDTLRSTLSAIESLTTSV